MFIILVVIQCMVASLTILFGSLLLVLSIYFIFMTSRENTYLSTRVRLPLYLGYLLLMIGGPLLLGSLVGLALGLLGIITIGARIFGEEKCYSMNWKATKSIGKK